jgi:hypothetical protein
MPSSTDDCIPRTAGRPCADCGEPIEGARLAAQPDATTCIECARDRESIRREAAGRDGVVVLRGREVRKGRRGARQLEAEALMPMRPWRT